MLWCELDSPYQLELIDHLTWYILDALGLDSCWPSVPGSLNKHHYWKKRDNSLMLSLVACLLTKSTIREFPHTSTVAV